MVLPSTRWASYQHQEAPLPTGSFRGGGRERRVVGEEEESLEFGSAFPFSTVVPPLFTLCHEEDPALTLPWCPHPGSKRLQLGFLAATAVTLLCGLLAYMAPTPLAKLNGEAMRTSAATLESAGSINDGSDDLLGGFKSVVHPSPPDADLWGNIEKPYPTGAWWLNFAIPGTAYPAASYPYAVKLSNGFAASYGASRRHEEPETVSDVFAPDLTLSSTAEHAKHSIKSFDSLSVTVEYQEQHDHQGAYELYFVKGAPYITVAYDSATPRITALALISGVNDDEAPVNWERRSVTGTEFTIKLSHGQTWVVFTSSPVTFEYTNMDAVASEPFSGVVRAAILLDESGKEVLRRYAGAYAVGGEVSWDIDGDAATLTYEWDKQGNGPLLMMAAPHHMEHITNAETADLEYMCMKGPMTAIEGKTWDMDIDLVPTPWHNEKGPEQIRSDWGQQIMDQIKLDASSSPPSFFAPDPYDFGKALARTGRVALIAHVMGDEESRDEALSTLGPSLIPWLDGTNPDALVYDNSWGGVVTMMGLNDPMADFGNGQYNDHHYHWSYILYGAAVLLKFQPAALDDYMPSLQQLVADIVSTQRNEDFPQARMKDLWDFHSWASGVFPQGNGKSQESLSEAINAYYAVALFGEVTGDDDLRDWGRLLTTMEIKAGQLYWQIDDDTQVYPKAFASNRMAGVVGALDVRASTWFGPNLEWVHGINMIPFTPITESWLLPDFVAEEYPVLSTIFDREDKPQDEWLAFVYMDQAVVEPEAAWNNALTLQAFDGGNSLTNTLYWIATRPQVTVTMEVKDRKGTDTGSALCSANNACIGLDGDCCPTTLGIYLDCCPSS